MMSLVAGEVVMIKKILIDDEINHSLQRNARVCREVTFRPRVTIWTEV